MKRLILLPVFLSLIHAGGLYAQQIKIVDKKTGLGVENVFVYNTHFQNATQSNQNGIVELTIFNEDDMINFQHPSYIDKSLSYKDLKSLNYIVELDERIIKINELIVSASKWEQDPEKIPNSIASIHSKEIEFNNPPTSADMLEQSGQVFVQKSQLGGGSPMLRGFSANSVLIVVDGIRMNNAIYRSGNLQNVINVDVNALDEAEVLFGPGSVMYGSDALGGVMDFHTKKITLKDSRKMAFSGTGLIRYSSAANERTGHADLSFSNNRIGSYTSVSFTGLSDLITGDNRTEEFPDYGKRFDYVERINNTDSIIKNNNYNKQVYSGYNQYSLIQKLTYRLGDFADIDYGFYYSNTTDIPRYDRLVEYDEDSLPVNAVWNYGPQKWMMNLLRLRLYNPNKLFDEAKFSVAHQLVEESRHDRKYKDIYLRNRYERLNLITFSSDFDKLFNNRTQLYYGAEFNYNDVQSDANKINIENHESSPTTTRYPDGGSIYLNFALYANNQWTLNDKHFLNAGIRYSYTILSASIEDKSDLGFKFSEFKNHNGAFNGTLGWVYRPVDKTKIDVILSSGFRAPNIDDMGKLFDSEPGIVIVPNKDLNPEYAYNIEAAITQRLSQNIQFHIVGYYTELIDAMVRRDYTFNGMDSLLYDGELRKVQALVNTGRARIFGVSVILKGDISKNLGLFASFNYTDGKDKIDQVPLRHAPPVFGQVSLYFQKNDFLAEINSQYSGKKEFSNLAPSEQNKIYIYSPNGTLAWYTLNFKMAYSFNKLLAINAGVENILNTHYRPYSSGISAPGRNFIFGLRVNL